MNKLSLRVVCMLQCSLPFQYIQELLWMGQESGWTSTKEKNIDYDYETAVGMLLISGHNGRISMNSQHCCNVSIVSGSCTKQIYM